MNRTFEGFVCIAVLIAVLFVGLTWQIKPAHAINSHEFIMAKKEVEKK